MNIKVKKEKGITLIALIITIIILVIIAAVSIRAITDMQIVRHAIDGSEAYTNESKKERNMLDGTESIIEDAVSKLNEIQEEKLEPGLYDSNGRLIKSWNALVTRGNAVNEGTATDDDKKCYVVVEDYSLTQFYWENDEEEMGMLVIGNNITDIGYSAFEFCMNLANVTIPNSVTSIGGGAFEFCENLTSITIPSRVTTIEANTFGRCYNLTNIILENGIESIGRQAFQDCTKLTNITIPSSVKNIDYGAFENCTSLTKVTLQDGIENIDDCVFQGCTHITGITIPNTVVNMGCSIFYGCTSLAYINVIGYTSKPTGWDDYWNENDNGYYTVNWNYSEG